MNLEKLPDEISDDEDPVQMIKDLTGGIGVYPAIGMAMNKNLTIRMGNCNHRKYIPRLIDVIRSGAFDPASVITQHQGIESAIDAYQAFDTRQAGWLRGELVPSRAAAGA